MVEKIGASIGFQLIDIFNILENENLTEEQKKAVIKEYQKSLTQENKGILVDRDRKYEKVNKKGYYVFGDIDVMPYEDLKRTKEYVDTYVNSFTCEVEMKMPVLIRCYDKESHSIQYDFELADKVYDYALSHGKDMRGHTLVWHKYEPRSLDEYIADRLGYTMQEFELQNQNPKVEFIKKRKELTKEFLADYTKNVGEHFSKCYCWDVLNEIVPDLYKPNVSEEDKQDKLRHSKWFEYLGKEFYIDVLEIARDNLPEGTKIFYNEYGENYIEKRKEIIHIIENIRKYEENTGKVLLDGIGLQSHYDLNVTDEQLEATYRDFAKTGKDLQITEIDIISGHYVKEKIIYDLESMPQCGKIWNKIIQLAENYNVKSFTGWGINDSLTWLTNLGCTMVEKDGSIKDFAKSFLEKVKERNENKKNNSRVNLTLQEIGKGTTQSFSENPETANKAFEALEHGINAVEKSKEEIQGES